MFTHYTLNAAGAPVAEPDLYRWAEWFETAERHVAKTELGPALVSTVFLGTDHGFGAGPVPILWETMVFWPGSDLDNDTMRYASREAAEQGHEAMVERVRAAQVASG
jgi:hypothetical protein